VELSWVDGPLLRGAVVVLAVVVLVVVLVVLVLVERAGRRGGDELVRVLVFVVSASYWTIRYWILLCCNVNLSWAHSGRWAYHCQNEKSVERFER
jgi:hypothetical protein